jgi:hypothetical protein
LLGSMQRATIRKKSTPPKRSWLPGVRNVGRDNRNGRPTIGKQGFGIATFIPWNISCDLCPVPDQVLET